jgi:hypothetical protein
MPRKVIGAVILGVMLAAIAAPGLEAPAAAADGASPSPLALAALRERLASERQVRLLGTFGSREIARPVLDSAGIASADWLSRSAGRPRRRTTRSAPPIAVPQRIAWSEISEVQVGHTMTGGGALLGALGGAGFAAIGAAVYSSNDVPEGALAFMIGLPALIVAGTVTGALIGRSHGRWRTVYRPGAEEATP